MTLGSATCSGARLKCAGQQEVARCTAFWRCCHKDDPKILGWGWDTEDGSFTDPSDGVETADAIKGEIFWQAS